MVSRPEIPQVLWSGTIQAGTVMFASAGECSEYRVMAVACAEKAFTPYQCLLDYLAAYPRQMRKYHFNVDQFLEYLFSRGLLSRVDCAEFDLGRNRNIRWVVEGGSDELW